MVAKVSTFIFFLKNKKKIKIILTSSLLLGIQNRLDDVRGGSM